MKPTALQQVKGFTHLQNKLMATKSRNSRAATLIPMPIKYSILQYTMLIMQYTNNNKNLIMM